MKERYNIEISDIQLSVVSDEPEDFVNSIVEKINERVNDLIVRNKRCSKLDAALLCALDYCGECTKAEKRIRNLEAQISLYDANLKRMREELAASQKASPAVKSALGIKDSADDDTEDKAQSAETSAEDNATPALHALPALRMRSALPKAKRIRQMRQNRRRKIARSPKEISLNR